MSKTTLSGCFSLATPTSPLHGVIKEKRLQKHFAFKALYILVGRARFELATNGLKVRKTGYLLMLIDVDKPLLYQYKSTNTWLTGLPLIFPLIPLNRYKINT